jgi:hypothetical protein
MAAPLPIKRGSDEPLLQKQSFSNDQTGGGSYTEEWRGISTAKMTAKWNGLVYTCRKATMEWKNDVASATFEWSGGTDGAGSLNSKAVTQDRWECPEPKSEKDLLTHPQLIYAINSQLSPTATQLYDILFIMRQYAEKAKSNPSSDSAEKTFRDALEDYLDTQGLSSPPLTLYSSTNFLRLWHLYANDQTHYQSSQYALRHTTSAPNGWALNVADLNCNCIYTTSQMLAECGNSSLWNFVLPGRLDFKLSAASSAFAAVTPTRANFQIGWLKSASAESAVGRGRIEIQTGFVLDQWSTDVYPLAT